MMKQTVTERKPGLLVAGALALISQSALGGDTETQRAHVATQEVVTVTAPRPDKPGFENQVLETNVQAQIEAIDRRIERDIEKRVDSIGRNRIELVISEVPTRG
jgi:hypothetical protein